MANDFNPIDKIVDYWRFENDLLAGKNGNDLTASAGGVGYSAVSPPEGSYALALANASHQWALRLDSELSSGFPLRSDDADVKATFAFWIKPTNVTYKEVFSKWAGSGKYGLMVETYFGRLLYIYWGYDNGTGPGTSYESWYCNITISTTVYNHIGVIVNGPGKNITLRIWNGNTATATTYSHNFYYPLSVVDAPFVIGNRGQLDNTYAFDGNIDEFVAANDCLSIEEIDAIRQGTYNLANPATITIQSRMQFVGIPGDYAHQPFMIF